MWRRSGTQRNCEEFSRCVCLFFPFAFRNSIINSLFYMFGLFLYHAVVQVSFDIMAFDVALLYHTRYQYILPVPFIV